MRRRIGYPACERHDEVMYPITGAGVRARLETGLWQCATCNTEFLHALDLTARNEIKGD